MKWKVRSNNDIFEYRLMSLSLVKKIAIEWSEYPPHKLIHSSKVETMQRMKFILNKMEK